MQNDEKKSFIMYKSFRAMLVRLPMEERGRLITAIYEYLYDGEVRVEMSDVSEMAFCAIKDTLDRDIESYAEKCRVNSENGKKGGRPRKSNSREIEFFAPKTERFFEKAKKADNDNGNENKNDNVTVNGDVNGNEHALASGEVSDLPHTPEREENIFLKEDAVLSDRERRTLEKEGIPGDYIDKRLERIRYYARKQKISVPELLREWWRDDSGCYSRVASPASPQSSSMDAEEFFNMALKRSYESLGMD